MPTRWLPPLIIAALALVFFADLVLHPTHVLYSDHSDLLAEHVPAKRFLVRGWQTTGEVPLWCPSSFAGSPVVHDIQIAAFYPLHFPLYGLNEAWIGTALSWLIVLHVLIAGWCMYAYARSQGLSDTGSLVAALGYMFAGKWMLHLLGAGHYVTVGLAWLPLVLLLLEQALRRRSLLRAAWAGVVYGLLVLGTHPQWTFYAGLFIILWTLASCPWRTATLAWWAGCGALAALVAVGLAAVQLLPTLEAAGQSSRSVGVDTSDILEGGLRSLLFLIGPALTSDPPSLMWEDRGGQALLWLTTAILAPMLCRGRVRYQAGVCLLLFLFAFGGAMLFQGLPGFRLFRQPARMLLVATFPLAFLAGAATDALFTGSGATAEERRRCRGILLKMVVVAGILVGGFALRRWLDHKDIRFHVYWLTLLATVPAAFWLLRQHASTLVKLAWLAVLTADLWGLAWPLVAVRREADIYVCSPCLDNLRAHGRLLDRDVSDEATGTPLGTGAPLALVRQLEPVRGYNPLDNYRYKEYLQFITDEDQPLRPLEGPLMFPVIGNFPIKNKPLLDLLGVRYLVQPSERPLEQEGWRRVAEDTQPRAYDFIAGGVRTLPAYSVYENPNALPRAFVVPQAAPLPDRPHVLETLKATDFQRQVLLEQFEPETSAGSLAEEFLPATITTYLPNRVVVTVDGKAPGYLVLGDMWFPGWTCTVDGQSARLYRANFLFRAVALPAGAREVEFRFEPQSYRCGKLVSGAMLILILAWTLLACAWKWLGSRPARGAASTTGELMPLKYGASLNVRSDSRSLPAR